MFKCRIKRDRHLQTFLKKSSTWWNPIWVATVNSTHVLFNLIWKEGSPILERRKSHKLFKPVYINFWITTILLYLKEPLFYVMFYWRYRIKFWLQIKVYQIRIPYCKHILTNPLKSSFFSCNCLMKSGQQRISCHENNSIIRALYPMQIKYAKFRNFSLANIWSFHLVHFKSCVAFNYTKLLFAIIRMRGSCIGWKPIWNCLAETGTLVPAFATVAYLSYSFDRPTNHKIYLSLHERICTAKYNVSLSWIFNNILITIH